MIKSVFALLSGSVASSFLAFLTQVMISRNLMPDELGSINSSISIALLLAPLVSMGCDGYLLKEYHKKKGAVNELNNVCIWYYIISLVILVPVCFLMSDIKIFVLMMVSQALVNLLVAHLQVNSKYLRISFLLLIQNLLRFFMFFCLILKEALTYEDSIAVYSIVAILVILVCLYCLIKINENFEFLKLSRKSFFSSVLEMLPYGLTVFLHLIYFQSSLVLISWFLGNTDAGYYSVAFTIISSAYILPAVIYQKYLQPKVHRVYESGDYNQEYIFFKTGFFIIFPLALISSLFLYEFSGDIIFRLFGSKYDASIKYVELMVFCVFFRYLSSNAGVFLMTGNYVKVKNKYMTFCAVFNVSLNVAFIPLFGIYASIYISIFTEILLCFLFYRGCLKYRNLSLIGKFYV